ncbi:MAG: Asp-tRNA(Asn)/Glu-tRNA(Gln) amidotransferase subunit GatB [Candidatus Berkelbacteria bacterium]
MSENKLKTTIGLEIHVQLKTKSKMFCRCDNNAEGKKPNTVVCPICLGLPGALPVANHQAIEWTIKTGLAFGCRIPATAKFDRKHYFYPDLPKGYQISQYDEPFCVGGFLEIDGEKIRLNRIHLEEDAGKLNHVGNASLVDLNRAGTPLMEIVTEPDLTSPKQAGEFLRKLQKIVRDVVQVSEASMEKGHMRCDANISVSDENGFMSPIVELKNINSFKFVEKALTLVDAQIRDEYETWPKKPSKETWGYDSVQNKVYLQRRKEEAADYRYFPCPDLPPFHSDQFDLEKMKSETAENEETKVKNLVDLGISEADAKVLAGDQNKVKFYESILSHLSENDEKIMAAKAVVHNYFGFTLDAEDSELAGEYAKALKSLAAGKIQKNIFANIVARIKKDKVEYAKIENEFIGGEEINLEEIVGNILSANATEVTRYQAGEKQLIGFFVGLVMKECKGKGNPQIINKLLREKLGE